MNEWFLQSYQSYCVNILEMFTIIHCGNNWHETYWILFDIDDILIHFVDETFFMNTKKWWRTTSVCLFLFCHEICHINIQFHSHHCFIQLQKLFLQFTFVSIQFINKNNIEYLNIDDSIWIHCCWLLFHYFIVFYGRVYIDVTSLSHLLYLLVLWWWALRFLSNLGYYK